MVGLMGFLRNCVQHVVFLLRIDSNKKYDVNCSLFENTILEVSNQLNRFNRQTELISITPKLTKYFNIDEVGNS